MHSDNVAVTTGKTAVPTFTSAGIRPMMLRYVHAQLGGQVWERGRERKDKNPKYAHSHLLTADYHHHGDDERTGLPLAASHCARRHTQHTRTWHPPQQQRYCGALSSNIVVGCKR